MSKIKTLYHRVILSFNKALVFQKKKLLVVVRVVRSMHNGFWGGFWADLK